MSLEFGGERLPMNIDPNPEVYAPELEQGDWEALGDRRREVGLELQAQFLTEEHEGANFSLEEVMQSAGYLDESGRVRPDIATRLGIIRDKRGRWRLRRPGVAENVPGMAVPKDHIKALVIAFRDAKDPAQQNEVLRTMFRYFGLQPPKPDSMEPAAAESKEESEKEYEISERDLASLDNLRRLLDSAGEEKILRSRERISRELVVLSGQAAAKFLEQLALEGKLSKQEEIISEPEISDPNSKKLSMKTVTYEREGQKFPVAKVTYGKIVRKDWMLGGKSQVVPSDELFSVEIYIPYHYPYGQDSKQAEIMKDNPWFTRIKMRPDFMAASNKPEGQFVTLLIRLGEYLEAPINLHDLGPTFQGFLYPNRNAEDGYAFVPVPADFQESLKVDPSRYVLDTSLRWWDLKGKAERFGSHDVPGRALFSNEVTPEGIVNDWEKKRGDRF